MSSTRKTIILWVLFAVLCFSVSYIYFTIKFISENNLQSRNDKILLASISNGIQDNTSKNISVNNIQSNNGFQINAKAAISVGSNLIYDDKIVFEKNSEEKLPVASLTKLMTALVVIENLNLSQQIVISQEATNNIESQKTLQAGQIFFVKDLLYDMLISSNNTAAFALSEAIGKDKFVELMNQKANDLGLKNTSFADPAGLSSQNISTAKDLIKLAEYILKNHHEIAEITKLKEFYVPGYGQITNTNQLLYEVPDIVFSKTGFTNEADGCLILVVNNIKENDYLVSVILGSDNRFSEMKKIINLSI